MWRGFSFALHPDPVQGFYFTRIQYSPIQAFTARFAVSMQLYLPRHKTAHMALHGLFLRLCQLNRPRYQTNKTSHCTACGTLEGIHAPGRTPPIPNNTATPERCTGQHNRLYYNKVYKRADHASPAACSLAPGQRSGAGSLAPSTRRGSPAAGGAEPLATSAASLFGLSPDS